jgi:hypothetical protein
MNNVMTITVIAIAFIAGDGINGTETDHFGNDTETNSQPASELARVLSWVERSVVRRAQ